MKIFLKFGPKMLLESGRGKTNQDFFPWAREARTATAYVLKIENTAVFIIPIFSIFSFVEFYHSFKVLHLHLRYLHLHKLQGMS